MKPTRLYIKQCPKTGLKYFGKHEGENIESYAGSGIYWTRHLKKHDVTPTHLWNSEWFFDEASIKKFALRFSRFNKIVESKQWANLKEENGLDGGFDHINSKGLNLFDSWSADAQKRQRAGCSKGSDKVMREYNESITPEERSRKAKLAVKTKRERYGETGWFKQSEEAIQNQKAAMAENNHQQGEKNSQFGTRWIYSLDEKRSAKIAKDEPTPDGWFDGRKIKF